jgi:hypothetical protein
MLYIYQWAMKKLRACKIKRRFFFINEQGSCSAFKKLLIHNLLNVFERMLSVMKCFEISDARFFALCKHWYHFARIKSLYFLASSVKFLLHCYSFYIVKVLLRLLNTYFFLYHTIIDLCWGVPFQVIFAFPYRKFSVSFLLYYLSRWLQ